MIGSDDRRSHQRDHDDREHHKCSGSRRRVLGDLDQGAPEPPQPRAPDAPGNDRRRRLHLVHRHLGSVGHVRHAPNSKRGSR